MELSEELGRRIRLYLAAEQSRSELTDWLAMHAQELSDLAHDGTWELQADVWMLVWQVEEGALDEGVFRRQMGELLPQNPAIVQAWPPTAEPQQHAQAASTSKTTDFRDQLIQAGATT